MVLPLIFKDLLRLIGSAYLMLYVQKVSRVARSMHMRHCRHKAFGYTSDLTHEMTYKAYSYLMMNSRALKLLLTTMVVHINLSIVIVLVKCLKDYRAMCITASVYLSKFLFNIVYHSTPPEGRSNRKWSPSRRLHWSKASESETFFSGHTSLSILAVLFSPLQLRPYLIAGGCITITSLILLRIHYIIDIAGAFLVVYFFSTIIR